MQYFNTLYDIGLNLILNFEKIDDSDQGTTHFAIISCDPFEVGWLYIGQWCSRNC